ncbi:MAG: MerR family transcriptional regulator, partial [Burkholderiales bacterium]
MTTTQTNSSQAGYSIGVVSKMTGIRPTTLRIWERRYGLVKPGRSEGRMRVYSEDDVRRLALIKTLVDAGHQISSVAPMTIEQLRNRLETASGYLVRPGRRDSRPPRVVLLGSTLPERLTSGEHVSIGQRIEIVGAFDDEQALKKHTPGLFPDVLVVEFDSVQADTLSKIGSLLAATGANHAVVIYGFAARAALQDLAGAGVISLRAPVALADVVSAVRSASQRAGSTTTGTEPTTSEQPPERRFTAAQLARISARSPIISCECPHHLVDLINSLAAFETYSRECENKSPEDAQIHAFLSTTTARSRAMLEAALERVARFE